MGTLKQAFKIDPKQAFIGYKRGTPSKGGRRKSIALAQAGNIAALSVSLADSKREAKLTILHLLAFLLRPF